MTYLLRAFCVFVLLVVGMPAHALDPAMSLSQYRHTAWRMQDGELVSQPGPIAQTRDGYLWVGTLDGLFRFDGVRFTRWTPPEGKSLPGKNIISLLAAPDGGLWIGTSVGLARWSNGELQTFPKLPGQGHGIVSGIVLDRTGSVWITRSRHDPGAAPLCRISGDGGQCFQSGAGEPCQGARSLAIGADDSLWLGSTDGLCRFRDGRFSFFLREEMAPQSGLSGIDGMAVDPSGALWLGNAHEGGVGGLTRFENGVLTRPGIPGLDTHLPVAKLMPDRQGALWVATGKHGIYRVRNGKAQHFGSADGLTSDTTAGLFEDREGNVWVTTSKGIDRFSDMHVATYSMREGLAADSVGSVLAASDGSVWIGNAGGLDRIRDGVISTFDRTDGLPGADVTSLLEDHAGRIWGGVDLNMVIRTEHGFLPVETDDGEPVGLIVALVEDPAGDVWGLDPRHGLVRFRGDRLVQRIPLGAGGFDIRPDGSGGLWVATTKGIWRYREGKVEAFEPARSVLAVSKISVDADGSLWASSKRGLVHAVGDQVHLLDSHNGLPCDGTWIFVKDDQGSMWLSTPCGYVRISAAELDRWRLDPDAVIHSRLFDAVDGAQPGWADFSPRVSKGPDGRLWFANGSLLQMIDPAHLNENRIVPPVHIEAFMADRKSYPVGAPVHIPPLSDDIQIDYTALSFVAPQHMKFRYRLEGHDTDWQDVGTRREAFYSGLAPGNYRFRVIASNNDGLWNEEGATLDFSIAPAWYQTLWFRALCILVFIGIIWGLHGLRLRAVAHSMDVRFNERLAERTRIARELHDTLLQGVQGLLLNIHVAAKKPEAESKPMLERALLTADNIIIEGRNRVSSLRVEHLTDDELIASIDSVAHELSPVADVGFVATRSGSTSQLRAPVADEVFYIVREALTNAFRHARATQIEVKLHYGLRHFVMSCEDDGCGFNVSLPEKPGHWGLGGMAERAVRIGGVFECNSAPGEGTTIRVRIPSYRAYSQSSRLLFHLRGLVRRRI